jgi:hypothetical protein
MGAQMAAPSGRRSPLSRECRRPATRRRACPPPAARGAAPLRTCDSLSPIGIPHTRESGAGELESWVHGPPRTTGAPSPSGAGVSGGANAGEGGGQAAESAESAESAEDCDTSPALEGDSSPALEGGAVAEASAAR